MKTLVSVVAPFYNEEQNVPLLSAKVDNVFEALPDYEYECLFVNDGSTDGTRTELDRLAEANRRVRPIHLSRNYGQSAALLAGMQQARGQYILTLDGDLQNDPGDFVRILDLLKEFDCVCGYRARRHDNWLKKLSSRIANAARNLVLHDGIRDTGCGTKGFRRCCIKHFVPFNGAHRYFAVMVQTAGLTVTECEVAHHPRMHGVTKYGVHNRLWRGIYDLFGVRWLKKRYVAFKVEEEA